MKNETTRKIVYIAGVLVGVGAFAGLIAGVRSCNNKGNDDKSATSATTSLIEESIASEPTETLDATVSTGDYVLETLNPDYSAPTRETTSADSNNIGTTSITNANTVIQTVNETTPNSEVIVIEKPTIQTQGPVSYETSAIETDINGTQPGWTEPEIKPSGTDPLPVEPTKITVNITAETSTTETNTTTEYTAAPTETIIVTVPIETVDPNDPNNVIEKDIKGKVLVLGLR